MLGQGSAGVWGLRVTGAGVGVGQGRSTPGFRVAGVWAADPSCLPGRKMDALSGTRLVAVSAWRFRGSAAQAVRDPEDLRVGAD